MSLNYKTYFRHVRKLKYYLCEPVSFKESLILTIKYVFSFFLVLKLYNSGLQVIYLSSYHLGFLRSVNFEGFIKCRILKDKFWFLVFFHMFFLVGILLKLVLYMTTNLWYGKCFVWDFLVLAFMKTAGLNTTYFSNFSWSGNETVLVCKLYISSL